MFEPHHSKHFEKTVETLCVYYSLVDNETSPNNGHHGNGTISDDCHSVAVGIGSGTSVPLFYMSQGLSFGKPFSNSNWLIFR